MTGGPARSGGDERFGPLSYAAVNRTAFNADGHRPTPNLIIRGELRFLAPQ